MLIPTIPLAAKPFLEEKRKQEANEWKKFNTWRLNYALKRLHKQKLVEISQTNNGYQVNITDKGKSRLLKYDLDSIQLANTRWDGKWRIIIYDVTESKKESRSLFRNMLKKLHFLQLQKSVYLTPYKCKDEIEYIRQVCNIGEEVVVLTISGLENEQVYKEYFGLS